MFFIFVALSQRQNFFDGELFQNYGIPFFKIANFLNSLVKIEPIIVTEPFAAKGFYLHRLSLL